MAYTIDNSNDFASRDGIESVTIRPANSSKAPIANVKAVKGSLNRREINLGGSIGLSPTDSAFDIQTSTLAGYRIKPTGDLLEQADGTVWIIKTEDWSSHNGQTRCVVRLHR